MSLSQAISVSKNSPSSGSQEPCRLFSLVELQSATDNFNQEFLVGLGGYGKVYKGTVDNGTGTTITVAIKRLHSESPHRLGGSEFWTEVKLLSKLRHEHLVSLIGYSNEGQEMILVYQYMEQGALEDHIYRKLATTGYSPLPWELRLKICIEAATGLHCLHTNQPKVIHRDVKSSNILLDANWLAKISDFGISKMGPESGTFTHLSTNVKGTFGYLDPDYFLSGKLTIKSDVYAFGVVLFEVLCGRAAVDMSREEDEHILSIWVRKCIRKGRIDRIVDSSLKAHVLPASLNAYVRIATKCMHKDPQGRPGMAKIIRGLNFALTLQLNPSSSGWSLRRWWKNLFPHAATLQSIVTDSPSLGMFINMANVEVFMYQQILRATSEFSEANLIKHGHSGDLYRGVLEGGILVVVKRIVLAAVKKESLMSELAVFSKVSHPRVVPLIGYCLENENEKYLIYKYMPNGNLSTSLFRQTNLDDGRLKSLDWITRLKIAIGVVESLSYLHHECYPPLVHRDVQASSILLDDKFEVRLGSFSEVCAQEEGIHQNRTSKQGASGTVTATCTYDVYCLGKVLLELVTGNLGISACSDAMLENWLKEMLPYISIYEKELMMNIIDPSLIIDEDLLEEVWAMAIVAKSCLNPKPTRRPLARYILKALENPLKVVREESLGSTRRGAISSRGSWDATIFGSWGHSSAGEEAIPVAPANKAEEGTGFRLSGSSASQGSGHNGEDGHSSLKRAIQRDFP